MGGSVWGRGVQIENGIDREYWAAKRDQDELATCSNDRIKRHFTVLEAMGILSCVRASHCQFHGSDPNGGWKDSKHINFGGETGELVGVNVNEYGDLVRRQVTLITQDRPVMKVIAASPGRESEEQSMLCQSLLDRDLKCGNLESATKTAPMYYMKYGEGWVYQWWDGHAGEQSMDPVRGLIRAGMAQSAAKTVYDVVRDPEEDPANPDWPRWAAVRVQRSRHDLAALYPQFADEIMDEQPERRGLENAYDRWAGSVASDDSDQSLLDTWVFYHRPCPALPAGRRWVLVGETIIEDGLYNQQELPLSNIIPFFLDGTPYGYSVAWDLMSLQSLVNGVMTTAHSNHDQHGTNVIWFPGSTPPDVEYVGNLQVLVSEDEPKVLQLNSVASDTMQLREITSQDMQKLSTISNVGRGETSDSRSGSSLAAEVAQSMQFMGPFRQAYAKLVEHAGTTRINLWKSNATLERTGEVLGLDSTPTPKKWKADSITGAKRVYVEVGSSATASAGGKVAIADTFAEQGWIKTPEQYAQVMETGRAEGLFDMERDHRRLAELENEKLRRGEECRPLIIDHHQDHILKHLSLLSDPEVRFDEALAQAVLSHIEEHQMLWQNMSEGMLTLMGLVPFVPMQPAMMMMEGGAPPPPPMEGEEPPMQGPPPEEGGEAVRYEAEGVPEEIGGAKLPVMPKAPDGSSMNPQGGF